MKKQTQMTRILTALMGGDWVSGHKTLNSIAHRYGARIYDLRQMGYRIETRLGPKPGQSWYRLHERKVKSR